MANILHTYAVRNPHDPDEKEAWICQAESMKDAAHLYLAEFWSAEPYEDRDGKDGTWRSPTYTGDIDGADLDILLVVDTTG